MDTKQENTIQAGSQLLEGQLNTINAVIAMIIPASEDGQMPGAGELNIVTDIINDNDGSLSQIVDDVDYLNEMSNKHHQKCFDMIGESAREQLIGQLKQSRVGFMQVLANKCAIYYYQHDRVLIALGLEPRSPFPEGNVVPGGDLSLLDPVRQRAPMYRE